MFLLVAVLNRRQTFACCCCRRRHILHKRHQRHFRLIREHLSQMSERSLRGILNVGTCKHPFQRGTTTIRHLSPTVMSGPFCCHLRCRQISVCSCLSVLFSAQLLSPAYQLFHCLGTCFKLSCLEKRWGGRVLTKRIRQDIRK